MTEKHVGEVVQVIGPVLDIRFAHDELPALLNAIEIDNNGSRLVAEVAQQTGDNTVRCIAMNSTDGLVRGAKALAAPSRYPWVRNAWEEFSTFWAIPWTTCPLPKQKSTGRSIVRLPLTRSRCPRPKSWRPVSRS